MFQFKVKFLILFLAFSLNSNAQSVYKKTTFDSLTLVINSNNSPSISAEAYFSRAVLTRGISPAKSINDYLSAIEICKKHKLHQQLFDYQRTFINYLYYTGRIQLSLHYYLLFTDYLEKNQMSHEIPQFHNIYGNLLSRQGNYQKALLYYYSSLSYAIKKHDTDLVNKSYLNIGVTRFKLGNYNSAGYYANKAIPYYAYKKPKELNNILELKAESYYGMGYVDTAYHIANQILNSPFQNNYVFAYAHQIIAKVYTRKQQADSAIFRYQKALNYSKLFGSKELSADLSSALSRLFEKKNDYKNALNYNKLQKAFVDSLQWQKDKESLDNMQLNFEIAKDRLTIKEQNQTIEKTTFKMYIMLFGVILLVLLFTFTTYAFLQKKRSNQIITKQKKVIEEKNLEMEDSIRYAQKIQETLLANKELANSVIPNSFLIFKPRDIVSGDFYWAAKKNDDFYLAVCDSTGHGVPGAFMSLLNINYLNEAVNLFSEPHLIFNEVRHRLSVAFAENERKDGMDGILICLNTKTNKLTYASAQNKPMLVTQGKVELLQCDKMHVGIGFKTDSFQLHEITYQKGDMLYLNTDGFCDQFGGPQQKKFMQKRLSDSLLKIQEFSCNEQQIYLTNSFESWKGQTEQVDDVCMIGIRL